MFSMNLDGTPTYHKLPVNIKNVLIFVIKLNKNALATKVYLQIPNYSLLLTFNGCRRSAVVKRVEHISAIVLVNI